MGLVKLIFGKSLTRLVFGLPWNEDEFFEMMREKEEGDVTVTFYRESYIKDYPNGNWENLTGFFSYYRSQSLEYERQIQEDTNYLNEFTSHKIQKELIKSAKDYSEKYPDINFTFVDRFPINYQI